MSRLLHGRASFQNLIPWEMLYNFILFLFVFQELSHRPSYSVWLLPSAISHGLSQPSTHLPAHRALDVPQSCGTLPGKHFSYHFTAANNKILEMGQSGCKTVGLYWVVKSHFGSLVLCVETCVSCQHLQREWEIALALLKADLYLDRMVSVKGMQLKHSAGIRCLCRVLCINRSFLWAAFIRTHT